MAQMSDLILLRSINFVLCQAEGPTWDRAVLARNGFVIPDGAMVRDERRTSYEMVALRRFGAKSVLLAFRNTGRPAWPTTLR